MSEWLRETHAWNFLIGHWNGWHTLELMPQREIASEASWRAYQILWLALIQREQEHNLGYYGQSIKNHNDHLMSNAMQGKDNNNIIPASTTKTLSQSMTVGIL